jgi:hypothetical protein
LEHAATAASPEELNGLAQFFSGQLAAELPQDRLGA